jgi:hypothetical protein
MEFNKTKQSVEINESERIALGPHLERTVWPVGELEDLLVIAEDAKERVLDMDLSQFAHGSFKNTLAQRRQDKLVHITEVLKGIRPLVPIKIDSPDQFLGSGS